MPCLCDDARRYGRHPRHPQDAPAWTLQDAAVQLGISPDAACKRLERGILRGEKRAGRWVVWLPPDAMLDADQDAAGHTDAGSAMAPLAGVIERLARENAELAAAAALLPERARFLGERLQALEASETVTTPQAQIQPLCAMKDHKRVIKKAPAPQTRQSASLVARWWRQLVASIGRPSEVAWREQELDPHRAHSNGDSRSYADNSHYPAERGQSGTELIPQVSHDGPMA